MALLAAASAFTMAWLWDDTSPPPPATVQSWFFSGGQHAILAVAGGLVDYEPNSGLYKLWEGGRDDFPCSSCASGALHLLTAADTHRQAHGTRDLSPKPLTKHVLVAMGSHLLFHDPTSGAWRAFSCPPRSLREGLPNPSCRKLGFGAFSPGREVTYLGAGRVMAWERRSLRYEVHSFAGRRGRELRNSSDEFSGGDAFLVPAGSGVLAGIHNGSTLLHLQLPIVSAEPHVPQAHAHVVLELLPGGETYRGWNSEAWAFGAPHRDLRPRSPLAGPVSRGTLPPRPANVVWTAAATEPMVVEVDVRTGAYRTLRVTVMDGDQLQPGSSFEAPFHFETLSDGYLDGPSLHCEGAATRYECAARGAPCGWCEKTDGVNPSSCLAGGPDRPCGAESCTRWRFAEALSIPRPPAPPPLPPWPPGLTLEDLIRLEAHSVATAAQPQGRPLAGAARPAAGRGAAKGAACACSPVANLEVKCPCDAVKPPQVPCDGPDCGEPAADDGGWGWESGGWAERAGGGGRLGRVLHTFRQHAMRPFEA